jgi:hypothetical protein
MHAVGRSDGNYQWAVIVCLISWRVRIVAFPRKEGATSREWIHILTYDSIGSKSRRSRWWRSRLPLTTIEAYLHISRCLHRRHLPQHTQIRRCVRAAGLQRSIMCSGWRASTNDSMSPRPPALGCHPFFFHPMSKKHADATLNPILSSLQPSTMTSPPLQAASTQEWRNSCVHKRGNGVTTSRVLGPTPRTTQNCQTQLERGLR